MRYLLIFLMAFVATGQIPGTFRVTGPVAPPATNSNFGATDTIYGKGGHVTGLSSLSQAQEVLRYPLARRQLGMHFSLTDGTTYQLQTSLTNFVNVTPIYTNAGVGYNITLLGTTAMETVNGDQFTSQAFIADYDGVAAPGNYLMPKTWVETRSTAIESYLTNVLALPTLATVSSNGVPRNAIVLAGEWPGSWVYCPLDLNDTNGANIRYPDDITTNSTPGRWQFVSSLKTTKTISTVADLLPLDPRELASEYVGTNTQFSATVELLGVATEGDGGGGILYWDHDDTTTTNLVNGGVIYQPTGYSVGRWKREVTASQYAPQWWGAFPSDASDDYQAMQSTVDYIKSVGGGSLVGSVGTFLLSQPLTLSDAYGVNIVGPNIGASKAVTNAFVLTRYDTSNMRALLIVSNTGSIYAGQGNLLKNVYFYGNATTAMETWAATNTGWGAGAIWDRVSYSSIEGCVFTRTAGPGIYCGERGGSANTIRNNKVELCGGSGIQAVTISDSSITGNHIGNNGIHLFTDETQTITNGMVFDAATSTVTLTGADWNTNVFSASRDITFYNSTIVNLNVWDILSISNNVLYLSQSVVNETISPGTTVYVTPMGNTDYGFGVFLGANNNEVSGNHIYQTTGYNIYCTVGRDNRIFGNRIDGPTRANIYLGSATRNQVYGNYMYDAGVGLVDVNGALVDPRYLRSSSVASGIYVSDAAVETTIQDNVSNGSYKSTGEENFKGEQYFGIYDSGKASLIQGNTLNNSKHSGYWGQYAVGPRLQNNRMQFNVLSGIYLFGTNILTSVIQGNDISYNQLGVVVDDGASAIIRENSFNHHSRLVTTIRSNIVARAIGQTTLYSTLPVTNFTIGEPIMVMADRGVWMSGYIDSMDSSVDSLTIVNQWRSDEADILATAGNVLQTGQMVNAVGVTADGGDVWCIGNMHKLVTTPYSFAGSGTAMVSGAQENSSQWLQNILTSGQMVVGDSLTTAANKALRFGATHYTTAEEPVGAIYVNSTAAASTVSVGGGTGLQNAATGLLFYTAANNTTTTGTARAQFDSNDNANQTALILRWNSANNRVAVTNIGGVNYLYFP